MARLSGINTKMKGKVGDWVFRRTAAGTIVSEKPEKKDIPVRSLAQMLRRVTWANLINLWRAFDNTLKPSFQFKEEKMSDFNAFMQANLDRNNPVAMTKDMGRQGGCVVDNYVITRGSLPSIGVQIDDDTFRPVTDIYMGDATVSGTTTLLAFSQAVIDNNLGWKSGDKLTVFLAFQSTGDVPRVTVQAAQVQLSLLASAANTTLGDIVGDMIGFFATNDEGYLGGNRSVQGGIAYVHSRKAKDGTTKVSSQSFVINNALVATYTNEDTMVAAIESYGGVNVEEEYLTPADNGSIEGGSSSGSGSGSNGGGSNGGGSNGGGGDDNEGD